MKKYRMYRMWNAAAECEEKKLFTSIAAKLAAPPKPVEIIGGGIEAHCAAKRKEESSLEMSVEEKLAELRVAFLGIDDDQEYLMELLGVTRSETPDTLFDAATAILRNGGSVAYCVAG